MPGVWQLVKNLSRLLLCQYAMLCEICSVKGVPEFVELLVRLPKIVEAMLQKFLPLWLSGMLRVVGEGVMDEE